MIKADATTTPNPSRRALLAGTPAIAAAALAGGTVANALAIAGAKASTLDPIFAAIEAHKAAERAFSDILTEQSALERLLPNTLCQSTVDVRGEHIVETDDPRWIANQRAVGKASNDGFDRALEFLELRPSTMAGLVSLFSYVGELKSLPVVELDEQAYDFPNALLLTAADWLDVHATPLAGFSAASAALAAPDPIFAVIAEHRARMRAWADALEAEEMADTDAQDDAMQAFEASIGPVLTTQPTTIAGVAALLEHVGQKEFLGMSPTSDGTTVLTTWLNVGDGDERQRIAKDFPLRLAATLRSLIATA